METEKMEKTQKIDSNAAGQIPPRPLASPKTTILLNRGSQEKVAAEGLLPVTGWLVLLNGKNRGRDFRLIQGENRIGRDAGMEVCLDFGPDSDTTVSREAHAIVVYDNHANEFFVERGNSRNLPLLNGKTIRRDQDLQAGDILQVGESQLRFVALCGPDFSWEKVEA